MGEVGDRREGWSGERNQKYIGLYSAQGKTVYPTSKRYSTLSCTEFSQKLSKLPPEAVLHCSDPSSGLRLNALI